MFTSSHMGLVIWDDAEDDFDHSQLAANFEAIDAHDHTSGKGKPISASAIESASITSTQLAEEAVQAKNIQNNSVGTEQIDPGFLPLGTVIQWYRKSSETPIPGDYEVMDGREWKTITNKMGYNTGNIPNMRNKFAKGAVASGEGTTIGETGGSATINLSHAHVVESHTHSFPAHTHSVPAHTHGIIPDGEHAHAYSGNFPTPGVYNLFQHRVGIPKGTAEGEYTQALRLANSHNTGEPEFEVPMLVVADHAHTGSTTATGTTTGATSGTSGGTAPNTDSKLSNVNIEPPWVGLLFLMKCR
jgi:hypothetical protein